MESIDPLIKIFLFVLCAAFLWFVAHKIRSHVHVLRCKNSPSASVDSSDYCVLCSKQKNNTEKMIAGHDGAVCSTCILESAELLDADDESDSCYRNIYDCLTVRKLDRKRESGCCEQHLRNYLIEKSKTSKIQREGILSEFISSKNYEYTKLIIENIPKEQWRYYEVLNWMWANSALGDFEKALEIPGIIRSDDVTYNELNELHLNLNKIAVELEIDKSEENATRQISRLLEIRDRLEGDCYPVALNFHTLMPHVLSNMAACHYVLGNDEKSKELLEERRKLTDEGSPFVELLAGKICQRQGDDLNAEFHWKQGLRFESKCIYSERIREKLNSIEKG